MEGSHIDKYMQRLVFIVEGDCEQRFVNEHLIDYLSYSFPGVAMHAQKITTNRKKNAKGGNVNYELFRNELKRTYAQGGVMITTLFDFFRVPTNFPGYSTNVLQISNMEKTLRTDCTDIVPAGNFLPYIQKHEFEALLFANYAGFANIVNNKQMIKIKEIVAQYPNPEDINQSPETAPSKRLLSIYSYKKVTHSAIVLKDVNIDDLRNLCPRFDAWVSHIEAALANGHF